MDPEICTFCKKVGAHLLPPQGTTFSVIIGCGTDPGWMSLGICTSEDQPHFHRSNFSPPTLVPCRSPTADTRSVSSHEDESVNLIVVWHFSKLTEAEKRRNAERHCSSLHTSCDLGRWMCSCLCGMGTSAILTVLNDPVVHQHWPIEWKMRSDTARSLHG